MTLRQGPLGRALGRRALAATPALAICLCVLMVGTAKGAFGPSFDLSAVESVTSLPQVAVDSAGNAHFVWGRDGGMVQTRRRAADGTLGAVQELVAADASGQQVAVDSAGNAHFVWRRAIGGGDSIVQTRRRAADGTLGAVQDLSAASEIIIAPQVAVDSAGNAHFAWHRIDGSDSIVQTRRRAAEGTLGPVQELSATGPGSSDPKVGVDPAGNAHFVWYNGTGAVVQTRRRAADGTLGAVQDIAPASPNSQQLAVDSAGNAHFAWSGSDAVVRTRRLAADGTLGAVQDLSGQTAARPQVAVDSAGNAHFAWDRAGGGVVIIQTRRWAADGTLGAVEDLSSGQAVLARIGVDSVGNAHFVWSRTIVSNGMNAGVVIQARRRAADGTLGAVQDLSAVAQTPATVSEHQLAVSPGGGAAAVWRSDGGAGSGTIQGAFAFDPPHPVIFVHGFLASRLRCPTGTGLAELWPHIGAVDRPLLGAMELAADGVSDAGDATCSGPVEPNGVLESVAGGDIHGSTVTFLNRIAPGANYVYAWDWRRSPEQAVAGLDTLVDQVRAAHGNQKVAIVAHSFGGLVTRWYIDDLTRAQKVERALIVGAPSWGSPKALFPLATGQETPAFSTLDPILDDNALKSFARNLTGDYFLYPSANYGTWLTVQGRVPSVLDEQHELGDYVNDDLLGNGALLQQALDAHANVLDGWETNGVDVRALIGTGVNTIVGVDLLPGQGTFLPDAAELHFGNGDETVPARSAAQGAPGTSDPLGENIPLSYACGVKHVPLAGDAALTAAGAGAFLQSGTNLTAPAQPCSNGGFSIALHDVDIAFAATAQRSHTRAASGQALADAEAAGEIDLVRFPSMAVAVTDDGNPVSLEIPSPNARMVVRRLDGETQGPAQPFGPFPDGIKLTTSAGGTIEVDPIAPAGGGPSPPPAPATGAASPAFNLATALKKCKKKKSKKARKRCRQRALQHAGAR